MAEIIGDLAVRIGADTSGLTKGTAKAAQSIDSLGSRARSSAGTFAMMGAAAAAAGAAIATAMVVKGLAAVDAQAKLARQLNATSSALAVVTRAGDLSGASLSDIETGAKKLSVSLGQAENGNKKMAETLDRLGLSASQVAALPLDQRILAVNAAIRENIPITEQAAVSADLFGRNAGFAMASLTPEAIAQAAKETELFGLNLSEVDAARVEQANDAMSQIGLLIDGISQQLAVGLAPALTAVMRIFTETAEEAGGVGDSVARASNTGIKAFGFLLDVVEGVKRAFELVGKVIVVAFLGAKRTQLEFADSIINGPIEAVNALIALMNKLPGVDIQPVGFSKLGAVINEQIALTKGAMSAAIDDIQETLMRPMPSGQFLQYVEEAKVAAEEAAAAASAVTGGGGTSDGGDKGDKEKADAEAQYIADRLERLREANLTELQLLEDKQMLELETINAGWEQKFLSDESWNALMLETKTRHEQEMTDAEKRAADARTRIADAEAKAKMANIKNSLSAASTLMNSESRKMFEIGKAAAIANSLISTYEGITASLKLGFPVGLIGAAAIGAAGFAQIANIRSQSFGGGGAGAVATGSNTAAVNAASTPAAAGPAGGTLTVQGLSAGSLFTGDTVSQLAESLLDYQRKGGSVVLAG